MSDKDNNIETVQFEKHDSPTIHFNMDHQECGKLFKKDGLLHFEGDVDKSAQVLFEEVCRMYNNER